MARILNSPTTMMATHIVREKFLTRGNIFVIALGFILVLLVPVSHACHAGDRSSSHTMKGQNAIDNPDQLLAESSLHIIYIDSANCSWCEIFNKRYLPYFKTREIVSKNFLTIIKADDYRDPEFGDWPNYLEWVANKAGLEGCGPQFVAMKGRKILGTHCGIKGANSAIKQIKSHANP